MANAGSKRGQNYNTVSTSSSQSTICQDEDAQSDGSKKGANQTQGQAKDKVPPMPWWALIAICFLRFAEPVALTSIFPYIPDLLRQLGVPDVQVGSWSGFLAATFSISQGLVAVLWSQVADRWGRKPVLLLGAVFTIVAHMIWGFSTSVGWLVIARATNGIFNGSSPIFRTTVTELVNHPALEPMAYSLSPSVYALGSTLGPAIGGMFYNPNKRVPGVPLPDSRLFTRFPALPPSLIVSCQGAFSIIVGLLFVPETGANFRHRRDFGIICGRRLINWGRKTASSVAQVMGLGRYLPVHQVHSPDFTTPTDQESQSGQPKPKIKPATIRECLTIQTSLNILSYSINAFTNIGMVDLIPVFVQQHRQDPATFPSLFRFRSGLGWDPKLTGQYMLTASIFGFLFQLFVYPRIAARVNALKLYQATQMVYPIVILLYPLTVHLPPGLAERAFIGLVWLSRTTVVTMSGPPAQMIIRSTCSPAALATVNGLITMCACVGCALGPIYSGSLFSFGLRHNFAGIAFIGMALVAFGNGILTCFLTYNERIPAVAKDEAAPQDDILVQPSDDLDRDSDTACDSDDEESASEAAPLLHAHRTRSRPL